jgi:diguanylate cyclase (GGDEF)-like protein
MLALTVGVFLTLISSLAANVILFFLLIRNHTENTRMKTVYSELSRDSSLDNVLTVIGEDLPRFGLRLHSIFRKNKLTMAIEDDKLSISILERSNIIRAFLTMEPVQSDEKSNSKVDSKLKSLCGLKVAFLPVGMKLREPCWKTSLCDDKGCKCYKKDVHNCWVTSDKRCRGINFKDYEEKLTRCMRCTSFLPVAVFAVSGRGLRKANIHIKQKFPEIISNAVMYERAKYSAYRDHLTGLINRRGLFRRTHELIQLAKRYEHPLSLCMLDIDHFKLFNDTYGHNVGDFVLKALSSFITSCLRETDAFARYGGEEFTILLPETTKEKALIVLDKIRHKVDKEVFPFQGVDHHITISMGVAEWFDDTITSTQALFKKADCALYHAKEKGRNKVMPYHIELGDKLKKDEKKAKSESSLPKKGPQPNGKRSSAKNKGRTNGPLSTTTKDLGSILEEDDIELSENNGRDIDVIEVV